MKEVITDIPIPISVHEDLSDCWTWQWCKDGVYTVSSAYSWLLKNARSWDETKDWRWVWKTKAPAKVQFLLWLVLHNALPTNSLRHLRGMAAMGTCKRCYGNEEHIMHCLRDCPHSREMWMRLGLWVHPSFFTMQDVNLWVQTFANGDNAALFMAGLWWSWCWRNNVVLGDGS